MINRKENTKKKMEDELAMILAEGNWPGDGSRSIVDCHMIVNRLSDWFVRYFPARRDMIGSCALPALRTALLVLLQCKKENGQPIPSPLIDWIKHTLLPAVLGHPGDKEEALANLITEILS